MAQHGKHYMEALEKIDRQRLYTPEEALTLVKETSYVKFNATVELHLRLGIDPRHSDQQIRTTVILPHGLGKTVRVLVFAEGEGARIAQEAGADYVADDEMIARIANEGWTDFDVALAVPDMMRKIGRLGKVLGRKGLMPNPKAGTLIPAEDIPRAIEEARAGRVEFRNDKTANVHVPIGRVGFTEAQLRDNMAAVMDAIRRARPGSAKGTYVRRAVLSSTMGPGIKVDPNIALNMTVGA
ncbi:MAG TPA: 50S ribosomal protein L1 [Aggregatilinea sp.]|jgi:large subunit ribosomal protein L1|uniref:50S ribosomal protein L1 n=1 Tax=Aggregatilinea sp. TaxID=2806333 RepID=UPI002C114C24|nr:50S ribosomal protein L1 [Aggregatilinea sp.]HML23100.1 50S ribosomal protein L1 [Aggregatilinea sp.]